MERWPEGGCEARSSRRGQPPPADGTAARWSTSQCPHSPLSPSATPRCSLRSASEGDSTPDAAPGCARYSRVLRVSCVHYLPLGHTVVPSPCSTHPIHCRCTPAHGGCAPTSAPASAHAAAHPSPASCAGVSLQTWSQSLCLSRVPLVGKIGPGVVVLHMICPTTTAAHNTLSFTAGPATGGGQRAPPSHCLHILRCHASLLHDNLICPCRCPAASRHHLHLLCSACGLVLLQRCCKHRCHPPDEQCAAGDHPSGVHGLHCWPQWLSAATDLVRGHATIPGECRPCRYLLYHW